MSQLKRGQRVSKIVQVRVGKNLLNKRIFGKVTIPFVASSQVEWEGMDVPQDHIGGPSTSTEDNASLRIEDSAT